jgi:hypothetical protein
VCRFCHCHMASESPPDSTSDTEHAPRDLREQLLADLASQFAIELEAADDLPDKAQKSLLALLDTELPMAADVISSLSNNDSPEEGSACD